MAMHSRREILDAIERRAQERLLACAGNLDHDSTTKVRAQRLELLSLRDEILATSEPNEPEIRPVI